MSKVSKFGSKKAHMIARPPLSEPFEAVAFGLVGPLPKGRGGCCLYLHTSA